MEYRIESLVHEGVGYGLVYVITPTPGQTYIEAQEELIRDVIGEDEYYSPRSMVEQIRIEPESYGTELNQGGTLYDLLRD